MGSHTPVLEGQWHVHSECQRTSHPSQLYDKGSSAEALVEAASSRLANALASWSALAPLASLQQNPRKGSDLVSATSKARFVATLLKMAAAVVGAAGWPCTKGSGTICRIPSAASQSLPAGHLPASRRSQIWDACPGQEAGKTQ